MFKSITIYSIHPDSPLRNISDKRLEEAISVFPAHEPSASRRSSIGFVPPNSAESELMYVSTDGTRVFNLEVADRVLPNKVIADLLKVKVTEIQQQQGRKLRKHEVSDLRDNITVELLAKSHIKYSRTLAVIKNGYLIIGTTSYTMADRILMLISTALARETDKPIGLKYLNLDAEAFMLNFLLNNGVQEHADKFDLGRSAVLKGRGVIRLSDLDITSEAIKAHLVAGMSINELSLKYDDRIEFTLANTLQIKKIKLTGITPTVDDEVDYFDSQVALMSLSLASLIKDLHIALPKKMLDPTTQATKEESNEL